MIIYEDEHLLVAHKPPGLNTHSPAPFAGEGLYEWLKNGDPGRATLAIIHRLDKETSGLIVFGKTAVANRSLTQQFERREVSKSYILLTDREISATRLSAKSRLVRAGEKYAVQTAGDSGEWAETEFVRIPLPVRLPGRAESFFAWEAKPATGRTHQIRVHSATQGFPILGDTLYGGTPAARVFLFASSLRFQHPVSGQEMAFGEPPNFAADPRQSLRHAVIVPTVTDAYRLIHGAADGWPGLYIDRLGDFLLAQSVIALSINQRNFLEELGTSVAARGIYHKTLQRQLSDKSSPAPQWLAGEQAQDEILVRENGRRFGLRLTGGYSTGLFLDQRENRRRLLTGYVAPDFTLARPGRVLNAFAYTCGFSVCAATAGAHVTSLDLSKKYLEWGQSNFKLNGLDPTAHEFIFGDAFDWFRRLGKKGRSFDLIILDPPTFSRSKENGVFRVENDYGTLVAAALPLLADDGVLLASTNAATLEPEKFLEVVTGAIAQSGRKITKQHYVPQPPDFPIHREEPAYLKTVWVRVRR